MASTTHTDHGHDAHSHDHEGDHDHHDDHHDLPWWQKYVFSSDHKVIGIQYGITGLIFLALGFFLMMIMRWSIAFQGEPIPWLASIVDFLPISENHWLYTLGSQAEGGNGGVMSGGVYNMFGAMHGTIMVFLGIVPLGFAAFGNFVTPLQIGAPDMAFPRLNMWSYWLFFLSGMIMLSSFLLPTGAASTGWTMYSPLATLEQTAGVKNILFTGQTFWLIGMVFNITASLLGAVNFITTIINLRAKGMTWMRVPFFTWAMLVVAFLLLLAFPALEVAAVMQLMDRLAGSSFFLPAGLTQGGELMDISGGGSPLLYQHLFWFLGHPEVYVLLLPAIAIVAEIIPANTRRPLWGYKSMVYGVLVLGFLSFIVWAHHMYLTGMGNAISTFFQTTTVIISIPSVILLTCLMISLWGGRIRFNTPMLFATAFLPMFGIGGLTGLPLAFSLIDLHLHDTYYVIGHFHYVVAPGILFGLFAGVYYWYPKATGRLMNETLGKLHFWGSLVFMNVIFAPMMFQGMAGFHRRWYNGGASYEKTFEQMFEPFGIQIMKFSDMNIVISMGAWGLGIFQIFFIINFFISIRGGRKVTSDNPWKATTLEWNTPTPPGHGNFLHEPVIYRGPYEYSVPGAERDYSPQHQPDEIAMAAEDPDDRLS